MVQYFVEQASTINNGNWRVLKDKPDKKVYYILEEGSSLITTYCEVYIDAPVQDVLSLLLEVDSLTWLFPEIAYAKTLKQVTRGRGFFYMI
mmetsp:Transcript_2340/g.1683  ORF Transcript_2340/g.1683 Transcript_2340/m.1683 type:complete len:91 (+) Transcript_2340:233-505(+)